jgi:Family of unknown function (DUF6159)
VARGFGDGARLMRASFELVRRDPALLWFPVISTCCLVLVSAFWIFEGAWLYAVNGPKVLYVLLYVVGIYSLLFVGVFFNVALAGASARALDGEPASVGDGVSLAWSRLGSIAGWAGLSLFVSFVLSFLRRSNRWLGAVAEVAWNLVTIFVVPLIACEGLGSGDARRRSFELAQKNWRTESGGLGALRAALVVPGLVFYLDARLLFEGHVHSPGAKALLGLGLFCGFALFAAVGVVRQVFAVELYRVSTRRDLSQGAFPGNPLVEAGV